MVLSPSRGGGERWTNGEYAERRTDGAEGR